MGERLLTINLPKIKGTNAVAGFVNRQVARVEGMVNNPDNQRRTRTVTRAAVRYAGEVAREVVNDLTNTPPNPEPQRPRDALLKAAQTVNRRRLMSMMDPKK